MNYTTQMDAARQGIITPQMETVARKEQMEPEVLRGLIAAGQVIIPANKNGSATSDRISLENHGIATAQFKGGQRGASTPFPGPSSPIDPPARPREGGRRRRTWRV